MYNNVIVNHYHQWQIQDLPREGTMASAWSASLNGDLGVRPQWMGVWGRSPQWGPGAEPRLGGQGASPPEAEIFL